MVIQIERDLFESGADIILHQVNCMGVMGSGVAKQVRERYPWVFAEYRDMYYRNRSCVSALLGRTQYVYIDEDHMIGNLFAQCLYGYDGKRYTDYNALKSCLIRVEKEFSGKVIAVPYLMGCHRGGGDWSVVEKMIHEIFDSSSNTLMICKYNGG